MIDTYRRESRRAYARQPKGSEARPTLYREHQAIIEACAARDADLARQALLQHLKLTTASLTREGEEG